MSHQKFAYGLRYPVTRTLCQALPPDRWAAKTSLLVSFFDSGRALAQMGRNADTGTRVRLQTSLAMTSYADLSISAEAL